MRNCGFEIVAMYIETEQKNHGFGLSKELRYWETTDKAEKSWGGASVDLNSYKVSRKIMGMDELWIWNSIRN